MKQTILVVDDDVHVREMVQVMLGTAGFDVVEAPNATSALSRLAAGGVDLLITDLRLPEMDGGTLISRVREEHAHDGVPILVVSGYADTAPMSVAADRMVVKPFEMAELVHTVSEMLGEPPAELAGQ